MFLLLLLRSVAFFVLLLPTKKYYYCLSFTTGVSSLSSSSSSSPLSTSTSTSRIVAFNNQNNNNNNKLRFRHRRCSTTTHPLSRLYLSTITPSSTTGNVVGSRISINEEYPGITKIYNNPDIFVIENFLDTQSCQDIINKAKEKTLERSPVAYAGWTDDFKDLIELAAKGPVAWIALIGAWYQLKDTSDSDNTIKLVLQALQNYGIVLIITIIAIAAFTFSRAESLKSMRTSTSTTLDDVSDSNSGPTKFVINAAKLFGDKTIKSEVSLFEAPTVIRYEPEQVLAPHYDANRSANIEDINRGGQTLATLIVYLNDVQDGGLTRFGKLSASASSSSSSSIITNNNQNDEEKTKKLTIQPKMGDALLFFPADSLGNFDERTEHEGCQAIDEKWIARIWRHQNRVPPPFGLSDNSINNL